MRPYQTIKLEEYPDVQDIQIQGRKSSVGKLREAGGDYKSYIRNPRTRKSIRRSMKRSDKARYEKEMSRWNEN